MEPHRVGISGVPGGKGIREAVVEACARLGLRCSESERYLRIYGDDICEWLSPCGTHAPQKRLPTLDFDEETVRAVVHGLDADSTHEGRDGKTTCFSTTSAVLALQYRVLQRMLGRSTSLRCVTRHGGFGSHPIYRVRVRTDSARRPWARIRSIGDGGDAHVYDLTTDTGRFYLPEADIVVHNCDDMSAFLSASLGAIGYPTKLRVVETVGAGDWSHIYVLVGIPPERPSRWVALDLSEPHPAGWQVPEEQVVRFRDFEVPD